MTLFPSAATEPGPGSLLEADGSTPRTFLLCRAGGRACGFDADAVLEVMPATPPAPLPGVVSPVLGLVCVRGAVVPVFDLAAALGVLLGGSAGGDRASARRARPGAAVHVLLRDGARLAVAVVDAVGELFELPPGGGVLGMPAAPAGRAAPLRGEIWRQAERVQLLDTAALLRAPSTALAAAPPGLSTSSVRP